MRPTATEEVAWSVYVSIYVFVMTVSPTKRLRGLRFRLAADSRGPKEPRTDLDPDHREKGHFLLGGGRDRPLQRTLYLRTSPLHSSLPVETGVSRRCGLLTNYFGHIFYIYATFRSFIDVSYSANVMRSRAGIPSMAACHVFNLHLLARWPAVIAVKVWTDGRKLTACTKPPS